MSGLTESNAVDVTDFCYPLASGFIIKLIAYDWCFTKLLDHVISKMPAMYSEKIWNKMGAMASVWVKENMNWSVMSMTLGLTCHSIFRFLALKQCGETVQEEEVIRTFMGQIADYDVNKVMSLLEMKMNKKSVTYVPVPNVIWIRHILSNMRQASEAGVDFTFIHVLLSVFRHHSSLKEKSKRSHGSMLETCLEDVREVMESKGFFKLKLSSELSAGPITLRVLTKWMRGLVELDRIYEEIAEAFFKILMFSTM